MIHNHEVAGSIPAPATIKEISKLRHGSLLIFVCVPLELFHGEGEVGVGDVFRPAHKMVYTHLRTVGIIDLQPIALRLHIVADGTEGLGCLFRQQGGGLQITVYACAHEIIVP